MHIKNKTAKQLSFTLTRQPPRLITVTSSTEVINLHNSLQLMYRHSVHFTPWCKFDHVVGPDLSHSLVETCEKSSIRTCTSKCRRSTDVIGLLRLTCMFSHLFACYNLLVLLVLYCVCFSKTTPIKFHFCWLDKWSVVSSCCGVSAWKDEK
jgi:hypothetical protein